MGIAIDLIALLIKNGKKKMKEENMETKQIIGKEEPKMVTINVGVYHWEGRAPIPKCDSCSFNDATHKIYAEPMKDFKLRIKDSSIGIRLCEECLGWLKTKLAKIRTGGM
jgi:hypothetical protein